MKGIEMTIYEKLRMLGKRGMGLMRGGADIKGLLSKSDVISNIIRTTARARFLLNAVPYARSVSSGVVIKKGVELGVLGEELGWRVNS